MQTFASILASSSRKTVLITGCDMFAGFSIASAIIANMGKEFSHVHAGYYAENDLVRLLEKHGAAGVRLAISDQQQVIDAYRKADVVVVVPPISDEGWGDDAAVFVHAAVAGKVKGLALCSKISAGKLGSMPSMAPLIKMEQAFESIKGKFEAASLVRCSVPIDMLWLFRGQIATACKISLSADAAAAFVPYTEADAAQGVRNMLVDPRFPPGTYELTGPEVLNFSTVARNAAAVLGTDVTYEKVSRDEVAHHLKRQGELSSGEVAFTVGMLDAVSMGLFSKSTDHLDNLLGRQPMSVAKYFEKNASDFKPSSCT